MPDLSLALGRVLPCGPVCCREIQLGGAGPAAYMPARVQIESLLGGGDDGQGAALTPCPRPLLLVTPVAPLPGQVVQPPPPSPACAPVCVPCVSLYECSLYLGARQRLNPDGVHLGDTLHLGLHLADTLHLPPSHVGRLSPAPHLGTRAVGNTQQTHSRSLVDTGQDGQRPSLHVFRPLSCSLTSARSGASVELFLRVLRSSWCALGKGSGARRVCLKQTRELP